MEFNGRRRDLMIRFTDVNHLAFATGDMDKTKKAQ